MKKKIQSYLALSPRSYRNILLIMPAAVPVFMLGMQVVILGTCRRLISLLCAVFVVSTAEIMTDALAFGGIASREAGGMEYLKSSVRGQEMLRAALFVNLARQLLEEIVILLLCQGVASALDGAPFMRAEEVPMFFATVLLGYFATVCGVAVSRMFNNVVYTMCVTAVEIVPVMGLLMLMMRHCAAAIALLIVLAAAVGSGGIWLTMKRGKESYYDKTA